MNNNKQTSVEWLLNWMKNNQYFIGNDLLQAVEQAKAMHKEEIIETSMNCFCEGKYSAEFTEKKINSSELINYAKEYFEQVYNENTNN